MSDNDNSAKAIIEDGDIVIRVPLANLQFVLDGGFACAVYDRRYKITNIDGAAKDICNALNDEDEEGTTPVHKLLDAAINATMNQGSEWFEEHEDQEIPGPTSTEAGE